MHPNLWIDDYHLNTKHGHKVFNEEKKAVIALQKEITKVNETNTSISIIEIINTILQVDRTVAVIAIDEAENTSNPITELHTDIAKKFVKLGDAYREIYRNDKSIDCYKKAWEHAQIAIK